MSGELFLNELSREKEAGGVLGEEEDKRETVEYNNPTNHRAVFPVEYNNPTNHRAVFPE